MRIPRGTNKKLSITKLDHESWRETIIRYSKNFDCEQDCTQLFDKLTSYRVEPAQAAFATLYYHDLCDFKR